ncbi:MAG: flagellar biosynthesis protein FlhB [Gammaproteobacteria bacterium]|nr:flagellar biosynthesis protein FlhB [Gammaproteobacteria bacterium]
MAQESGQERTEEPTPKRQADSKKKGQIARSRDFNTMAIVALAAAGLLIMGGKLTSNLSDLMIKGLSPSRAQIFDPLQTANLLLDNILQAIIIISPFLVLMFVASLLAPIMIGGWAFSWEALQPKFSKLNPISGIKKMFSAKSLLELVKTMAKFILVTAVAITVFWSQADSFLKLGSQSIGTALSHAGYLFGWGFLMLSVALIIIAAIDVPFQIWDHLRQMKMTLQEVKDEMKDSEGRPEVKGKIRQLQREIAERRMLEDVPQADVVITNPEHFAVALKYDQTQGKAPMVVAKGADIIAASIRKVAIHNDVTLVEAPPLARAIFYNTEIGDEIPEALYLAVAQILAYVFHLKTAAEQGTDAPDMPKTNLPDEYKQFTDEFFNKSSGPSNDRPQ